MIFVLGFVATALAGVLMVIDNKTDFTNDLKPGPANVFYAFALTAFFGGLTAMATSVLIALWRHLP